MHAALLLFGLLTLSVYPATAQQTFNSYKICHDGAGFLQFIETGNYTMKFKRSQFVEFSSRNGFVRYDGASRKIVLKDISIQLLKDAIVFTTKDSSLVLRQIESKHPDTTVSMRVGKEEIMMDFNFGKPYRLFYYSGNNKLSILFNTIGYFQWSIVVDDLENKHALFYYGKNKTGPGLEINNETSNEGLHLYAYKNKTYNFLMGTAKSANKRWNGVGPDYQLRYSKNGKLKKSNSKFNLVCN